MTVSFDASEQLLDQVNQALAANTPLRQRKTRLSQADRDHNYKREDHERAMDRRLLRGRHR